MALVLGLAMPGCRGSNAQTAQAATNGDPADVNDAAAQGSCPAGQVLMSDGSCQNGSAAPAQPTAGSTPQSSPAPQGPAPASTYNPAPQQQPQYPQQQEPGPGDAEYDSSLYDTQNPYDDQTYQQDAYNNGYQQGYETGIQASQPPPQLPVYAQPSCPGPGYLWNPGYWYWGAGGYYWVPGVWVAAPYTGALWTPGWWGFLGGFYRWHHGYWGPHIGFYGGIPYGYGYTGSGYHGGYWDHDRFMYNRSVTNITNVRIVNVYNRPVPRSAVVTRVSYNGGRSGLAVRPTQTEFAAMREQHVRPLPTQVTHRTQAMQNRQSFASVNHGRPAMAVATKPLAVHRINPGPSVVNPGVHGATRPAPAVARPNQPVMRPGATPNHTQPVRPTVPAQPARPSPGTRPQPSHTPPTRPESRPTPQTTRPAPQVRPEQRPVPQHTTPQARPQPQHTTPQPRPQTARPQQYRPETRPAPQARPQARPESQHSAPRETPHENPHEDHPHR